MRVLAIAAWRQRVRKKRKVFDLRTWPETSRRDLVFTEHELGKRLGAYMRLYLSLESVNSGVLRPWWLVAEDVFVFKNPKVAVIIARNAGMMVGPLEDLARAPASWEMAARWRKRLFGLSPFTGRVAAKQATQALLPQPFRLACAQAAEALNAPLEDICDAAGITLAHSMLHEDDPAPVLGIDPGKVGAAMLIVP